jgi:hypothetical protein
VIFAHLIQPASNLPTDPSALESSISALESAISALESDIRAFESSSAHWEPWVWVFSALVVLGVVMELWVIQHDWREEMESWAIWYFMDVTRFPSRPSMQKLRVEIASVVLISIGVAGELAVGVEISHINGMIRDKTGEVRTKNAELRSKSDQLVALLQQQVEEEKIAEGRAHREAAAKLEEEKGKRVELAASVLGREFTDQGEATDRLSQLSPVPVYFEFLSENEPKRIAEEMNFVLNAAGWLTAKLPNEPLWDGVMIEVGSKASLPPTTASPEQLKAWDNKEKELTSIALCDAKALVQILESQGIESSLGSSADPSPVGTLLVMIGANSNRAWERSLRELARKGKIRMVGDRLGFDQGSRLSNSPIRLLKHPKSNTDPKTKLR